MFVGGISETRTKKPKTCAEGRLLSASLAYSGCIVLVKSHFPGVTCPAVAGMSHCSASRCGAGLGFKACSRGCAQHG